MADDEVRWVSPMAPFSQTPLNHVGLTFGPLLQLTIFGDLSNLYRKWKWKWFGRV